MLQCSNCPAGQPQRNSTVINPNTFADANEASAQIVFSLASQALQGVEQLAALNLQAIKTLLSELEEGTKAALSATSPAELVKLQTAALQAAPQKALAYAQHVKATIADATAAQRAAIEAQVANAQGKFLDAFGGALKNIPGSEETLALAKSAVAATNSAYDNVNKASKQASETLAKVAEAAVKPSSSPATIDA